MKTCRLFPVAFCLCFFFVLLEGNSHAAEEGYNYEARNKLCPVGLVMSLGGAVSALLIAWQKDLRQWFPKGNTGQADYEDSVYSEGISFMKKGNYPEAKRCFEKILKSGRRHMEAKAKYGYILMLQGEYGKALSPLKECTEAGDKSSLAYLGYALFREGQYKEALSHLKEACTAYSPDAGKYTWIVFYAVLDQLEECQKSLGFLQSEVDAKGAGTLECKENLKSLREKVKSESLNALVCLKNLKILQTLVEARNMSLLECEASLRSLLAEAETGYMYKKVFLSLSKHQQALYELSLGAFLSLGVYALFKFNLAPFGYKIVNGFLTALFMVGITNFMYGTGRMLIILGDFIYETDLAGNWWQYP